MAEWSIASDLKSDELLRFREFKSHSLLGLFYRFNNIKVVLRSLLSHEIFNYNFSF